MLLNCIISCNLQSKNRYVIYVWKLLNLKLPDKFLLHWEYKNIFYCLQIYNFKLFSSWMCFRIRTSNLFLKAANVEFSGSPCLTFPEKCFALMLIKIRWPKSRWTLLGFSLKFFFFWQPAYLQCQDSQVL